MSRLGHCGRWIYGLLPGSLQTYLAERPGASLFAANSLWLLFDKLIRLVLALTVGAWVARNLGPHAFGELAYAITFIALFQGIANLGLDGIVVRDLSRNPAESSIILGTVFRLRLIVGGGCWLSAIGLICALRPDDKNSLILISIIGVSLIFQSAETVDLWFQCQSQNKRTVAAKLFSYIIANSLRIILLTLNAPLWTYAAAFLMDAIFLSIALTSIYRKFPAKSHWKTDWKIARSLLNQSWPFMLSGVAVLIYMRIDQIMIREMLGEKQLGIYSSAVTVSQLWNAIPGILAIALAPYIARKKIHGTESYMAALFLVFRIFAATSLVASIITAVFSKSIISLLYGDTYAPAASVLAVHAFSNIPIFMGVAQGLWLINEGLGKITLYRTALGLICSVLGNFLLIPIFGILGAAITSLLSTFIAAIASNAILAPQIMKLQLQAFMPNRFNKNHQTKIPEEI